MSEFDYGERAQQAHDDLIKLAEITVQFAGVERVIRYPSDRPENDAEHSFHLAISAVELAANYYPELDAGLVSQFCLVHDLPEVYAGDTPSYNISDEDQARKELIEKEALDQLLIELPPYLAQLLSRYEEQTEPEARFVRFVDKLLPALIHIVATEYNRDAFFSKFAISSFDDMKASSDKHSEKMKTMFPEFDFLHILRGLTVETSLQKLFPD